MEFYTLKTDGSCGPKNPGGTAAYGFILTHNGTELERGSGVIGSGPTMSNNLAEYYAMAEGFLSFLKHYQGAPNTFLSIRADSKLVINQLKKKWKASPDGLYYQEFRRAAYLFDEIRKKKVRISIEWVPRIQNKLADELSKAYQKHAENIENMPD